MNMPNGPPLRPGPPSPHHARSRDLLAMTPGFHGSLSMVARGERLWELTAPVVWADAAGRPWIVPTGFGLDFWSVPRPAWWFKPPANGYTDLACTMHDFECRSHNLLGLTRKEIDLRRFPRQMRDVGISAARRRIISRIVRLAYMAGIARGEGIGWHGSEAKPARYDLPVIDYETGAKVTLAEYVRAHYRQDGQGYRTLAEMEIDDLQRVDCQRRKRVIHSATE